LTFSGSAQWQRQLAGGFQFSLGWRSWFDLWNDGHRARQAHTAHLDLLHLRRGKRALLRQGCFPRGLCLRLLVTGNRRYVQPLLRFTNLGNLRGDRRCAFLLHQELTALLQGGVVGALQGGFRSCQFFGARQNGIQMRVLGHVAHSDGA
jgi:hypothetical protein